MKIVETCPDDIEIRRAGLALIVGVAEHGDGLSDGDSNLEDASVEEPSVDGGGTNNNQSFMGAAAVVNRFGIVGAVAFVAAWLREVTAPAWAWGSAGYYDSGSEERVQDLLLACKAATLLSRDSYINRDRLAEMGACDALTRAVAMSARSSSRNSSLMEDAASNVVAAVDEVPAKPGNQVESVRAEIQMWAAQAIAELAGGHANENRCILLVKAGAMRALFAAMTRRPSDRQIQRAGCLALGSVAFASRQLTDLQALGRCGGAQAVIFALDACPGDEHVAWAGLLAVAKLAVSADNRRLLGEAGACPLTSKVLLEFAHRQRIAEEGCQAVAGLAALSGFNRTALGHAGAAEATAAALRNHPAKPTTQGWGLTAAASLVADTDPSDNTSRITRAGILDLSGRALARFPHNPTIQAEGLRVFAKVSSAGDEGIETVWKAGAVHLTIRALGLYLNDGDVQHWGMATMRALTSSEDKCHAWRTAGAPEAVVRTLRAFGEGGGGRRIRHDESGEGRLSEARLCTPDEALSIQFQACACALRLADASPDCRRRIVQEGAGEALAGMMKRNPLNLTAQRGALATLAALSVSGKENRRRLLRSNRGVPQAIVAALEAFPDDRRVRCEGTLAVQNLSFTVRGARVLTKAGVAPVIVRLLRAVLEQVPSIKTDTAGYENNKHVQGGEELVESGNFDREGETHFRSKGYVEPISDIPSGYTTRSQRP